MNCLVNMEMKTSNSNIEFSKFLKISKKKKKTNSFNAIIYTRVSTKEQADTNKSLDVQKKACEEFAKNNGLNVVNYFGGTFESAKSDNRREFKEMLKFVRQKSNEIEFILVYSMDRFSRTGDEAMTIVYELRKNQIYVQSVTQVSDQKTAEGELQQNINLIFAKYDNDQRRRKTIAGMKANMLEGKWCSKPPRGYSKKDGELVINKEGDLIKKAFMMKASGKYSNHQIIEFLNNLGFKIKKQSLSDLLKNVFYCGKINSALIGKIVDGNHSAIISERVFLQANNVSSNRGYKVDKEVEGLPLRGILLCDHCNTKITGYLNKKKGLYYYKCNKIGCKKNISAKIIHESILVELNKLKLDSNLNLLFIDVLKETWNEMNKLSETNKRDLESCRKEETQKLDVLEERWAFGKITDDVYNKFSFQIKAKLKEIDSQIRKCEIKLSNLDKYIQFSLNILQNIDEIWEKGNLKTKKSLINTTYPEGIFYNKITATYRTPRVNEIFRLITTTSGGFLKKESGQSTENVDLSAKVAGTGLEPMSAAADMSY